MKILVSGYYGGGNFGDEALLVSIKKNLESLANDVNLCAISYNPVETKKLGIKAVYAPLFNRWFWKNEIFLKKAIKESDLIIIGGGQLLQDSIDWQDIGNHMLVGALAKLYKKKVAFYSIGAGPINSPLAKFLVKNVSKNADMIVTRDIESASLLKKLSKREVLVGSDIVLNLVSPEKVINSKKSIGISLREYNFPKEKKQEIIAFVKQIASKYNVYFIATENDDLMLAQIQKESGVGKVVKFKKIDDYIEFFRKIDLMIGMRFHFLILSTLFNKPCIGLLYDPKVASFCKRYNFKSIKMKDISSELLSKHTKESINLTVNAKILDTEKKVNIENLKSILNSKNKPGEIIRLRIVVFVIYFFYVLQLMKRVLRVNKK